MKQPWDRWVIDASMSRDGLLCFVPVEGDLDGEHAFVIGMNFVSDRPPENGKVVAIIHPDGQEAVEAWMNENKAALEALKNES